MHSWTQIQQNSSVEECPCSHGYKKSATLCSAKLGFYHNTCRREVGRKKEQEKKSTKPHESRKKQTPVRCFSQGCLCNTTLTWDELALPSTKEGVTLPATIQLTREDSRPLSQWYPKAFCKETQNIFSPKRPNRWFTSYRDIMLLFLRFPSDS